MPRKPRDFTRAQWELIRQAVRAHVHAALRGQRSLRAQYSEQDLVNEVIVEFLQHLDSYDPARGSPEQYAVGFVRNVLGTRIRKELHRCRLLEPELAVLSERVHARYGVDSPDELTAVRRFMEDVKARLHPTLGPQLQKMFGYFYEDWLTDDEIRCLGYSSEQIQQSRWKLRKLISDFLSG